MDFLNKKLSFPAVMLEFRGLVKLDRLSGKELSLSSWWISLAAKLAVYRIIDLVADMDIDAKR